MAIYALLVGINDYLFPKIKPLKGCHNDVGLMYETLQSRFSVPDENIKTLCSTQATKAAIVETFQTHFAQANDEDTVVFYFSGHGSQEPAAAEFWHIDPDKQLETLVCYDSEVNDTQLANKEVRFLISQLNQKLKHVVLIIDSCHSGHINRVLEEEDIATRQASFSASPRAMEDFIFYDDAVKNGWINNLKEIPQGKNILLTACRNTELSQEQNVAGERHGAFTYSLCKTLETLSHTPSYYNLLTRVRPITQKLNSQQTPQIAAYQSEINETFLGTDIQPVELKVYNRNKAWWIDAGHIHGLNNNDEIAIFPTDKESKEPLLFVNVFKAEPGKCQLTDNQSDQHETTISSFSELDSSMAYPAHITHHHIEKLRFSMEGKADNIEKVRQALLTIKNGDSPSDFIEENAESAEYRVNCHADGNFYISDAKAINFRPLFEAAETATQVLKQLENIKRFKQKLELANDDPSVDSNTVQIVITEGEKAYIDEDVTLHYDPSNTIDPRPKISFAVRCNPNNMPKKPVYCALVLFDSATTEVNSGLNNEEQLIPSADKETCKVNYLEGREIPFEVKDALFEKGITETHDYIKLIVSDTPFDAKLLNQPGMKIFRGNEPLSKGTNALTNLLEQAMKYSHTRSFDLTTPPVIPQWYTKTFELSVVRPGSAVAISAQKDVTLTQGVSVQAHASLQGASAKFTNPETLNRSLFESNEQLDNKTYNLTPPLFRDDGVTPPYSFSSTRDVTTDLSVLELYLPNTRDITAGGTDSITPENPLIINVDQPLDEKTQILPYSYNGEFYLPLGYAKQAGNQTQIIIQHLPDDVTDFGGSSDKSLGKSLKVFFQQVLFDQLTFGEDQNMIGSPVFDEYDNTRVINAITDTGILKDNIQQADKILLYIHGIIGETQSMAGSGNIVMEDGSCIHDQYDLVLTYDYENLNTPIDEIAKTFKEKLQALGLGENHGKQLDIVAHSMGGLVSRYLIEAEGGDKIVSKLVMFGTPNGGTALANVKNKGISLFSDWANNTLTALINGYLTNGVGNLAVAGLMKLIESIDNSFDDMHPDSKFLGILAHSQQPPVPYFIIAGNTDLIKRNADTDTSLFKKMTEQLKLTGYKQLTNFLYQGGNDIAVSVESICSLPEDWDYAEPKIVACDHLSYFDDASNLGVISHTK
jgi:hypothetical protein